jgi:hypothetical protein
MHTAHGSAARLHEPCSITLVTLDMLPARQALWVAKFTIKGRKGTCATIPARCAVPKRNVQHTSPTNISDLLKQELCAGAQAIPILSTTQVFNTHILSTLLPTGIFEDPQVVQGYG